MSEELREKIDMELATDGDVALCADADSDMLVVEYVSDDEASAAGDSVKPDNENDDECDHVLKVTFLCNVFAVVDDRMALAFRTLSKYCTVL